MALIYFERILDLGDAGLLTLTQDMGSYLPLPADRHGHARWHRPDGGSHDRLEICTRAPGLPALRAAAQEQQTRFAGAVASVRGRVTWVTERLHEGFREAPTHASALDGGRVLLVFGGVVGEQVLRVVDIPANRIVAEESSEALAARLGIRPMFGQRAIVATPLARGGPWWAAWLGAQLEMLTLRDGRIERAARALPRRADRFALTAETWFVREYDPLRLQILASQEPESPAQPVTTPFMRDQNFDLAPAGESGRCVLAHPGGVIELIDAAGRSLHAVRPFPTMARKDTPGLANVSASGRYLLCGDGSSRSAILDLQRGVQTQWPMEWDLGESDRTRFVPEIHYRSAELVTDRGLARLHRGELWFEPPDGFDWAPTPTATTKPTRVPRSRKLSAVWNALRRPALALVPDKDGDPGCQLYGLPCLPADADWPRHAGQPMALLCQLDLTPWRANPSLAPLPVEGALLVFIAVDDGGEPLLDDTFDPVAVRVLLLPQLGRDPVEPPPGCPQCLPAQPLRVREDSVQWPQLDAVNLADCDWSVAQLDAYRAHLDQVLPDGPPNGHRLGGYPTLLQHNDLELDAAQRMPGAEPSQWRLLLQLDSDGVVMWGTDSGMLYLMIEEPALAARDFSRVVALTQGC